MQEIKNLKFIIIAIASLGMFLSTLDTGIINIAIPFFHHYFQVSLIAISWVFSSYLLALMSMLLVFGHLADSLGIKKVISIGFIIFLIGSITSALAFHFFIIFIIGRTIQGLGAAALQAVSIGLITTHLPKEQHMQSISIVKCFYRVRTSCRSYIRGIYYFLFIMALDVLDKCSYYWDCFIVIKNIG